MTHTTTHHTRDSGSEMSCACTCACHGRARRAAMCLALLLLPAACVRRQRTCWWREMLKVAMRSCLGAGCVCVCVCVCVCPAEQLSRVLGTERDRVNCPFYFRVSACTSSTMHQYPRVRITGCMHVSHRAIRCVCVCPCMHPSPSSSLDRCMSSR